MHKTTIKWEIHNPELDSSGPTKQNLELYKALLNNKLQRKRQGKLNLTLKVKIKIKKVI